MLQPILQLQINEDSEKLTNLSAETLYRPLIPKHYFSPGSLDFAQCRQPRPLLACQLFNVYGIPAPGCILTSVCPVPTWGSSIVTTAPLLAQSSEVQAPSCSSSPTPSSLYLASKWLALWREIIPGGKPSWKLSLYKGGGDRTQW